MWIILRFTLRNIKEKKFRTFLIIFAILISTALFFASVAVSETIEGMVTERIRQSFGTAEIMIHAGEESPVDYVNMRAAKSFYGDVEYIIGVVTGSGVFRYREAGGHARPVRLELRGYELDDLAAMNPVQLTRQNRLYPFSGKKLIISESTAEKYGLEAGAQLDLEIEGAQHRFHIAAVAASAGVFSDDGHTVMAIMPRDTLSSLKSNGKQVNLVYLKPRDMSKKQALIEALANVYSRYVVRETLPQEDIERGLESYSVPFLMMTVLVSCVSIFIIYTSFLVIIAERLPVIGTFRSIGAAKMTTDMVLLAESLCYGVIGGISGCLSGIGALYIVTNSLMTPYDRAAGLKVALSFSFQHLVAAFTAAVLLSFLSSLIPILKASRIPVKEIVLNRLERGTSKKRWKGFAGVAIIAASLLIPATVPVKLAVAASIGGMATSVLGLILCIPWIIELFVQLFQRTYAGVFGNEGILAAKNLRGNKSIQNNISLLAIGISSLLLIFTISHTVIKESANVYRDMYYDIRIPYIDQADRQKAGIIAGIEGVEDVYGCYSAQQVEVLKINGRSPWKREFITDIMGTDPNKHGKYLDFHVEGDEAQLFSALESERSLLLSNTLKKKYGVSLGDTVILNTPTGEQAYKIIGFLSTVWENGQLALASERYLRLDMKARYYNDIYVKTDKDPDVVVEDIKERFRDKEIFMLTKRGFEMLDEEDNAAILGIMQGFAVMAMVIGIFGIMNNFAIGFFDRKRILAVMRSSGMSRRQVIKMIVIEALSGGIIGGTAGVLAGLPMVAILPYLLRAIDLPEIKVQTTPAVLTGAFASGIIITLIASLSPAAKASKLNIIESIKYE